MSITSEKIAEANHYLGIDFGLAEVGLALADFETKMAFTYKAIRNDKDLMLKLREEIRVNNVKVAVIGIPAYFKQKGEEYAGVRLGRSLEKELGIRVEYFNEMFTTKMAQANLVEKGVKGVKRYDDQEAARIILQEWLDNREKL